MAERNRVPRVDLRAYRPGHQATGLLTRRFCEERGVIPVNVIGSTVIIAMANPDDQATIDEVRVLTGKRIEVVRATSDEIRDSIVACYGDAN